MRQRGREGEGRRGWEKRDGWTERQGQRLGQTGRGPGPGAGVCRDTERSLDSMKPRVTETETKRDIAGETRGLIDRMREGEGNATQTNRKPRC